VSNVKPSVVWSLGIKHPCPPFLPPPLKIASPKPRPFANPEANRKPPQQTHTPERRHHHAQRQADQKVERAGVVGVPSKVDVG